MRSHCKAHPPRTHPSIKIPTPLACFPRGVGIHSAATPVVASQWHHQHYSAGKGFWYPLPWRFTAAAKRVAKGGFWRRARGRRGVRAVNQRPQTFVAVHGTGYKGAPPIATLSLVGFVFGMGGDGTRPSQTGGFWGGLKRGCRI